MAIALFTRKVADNAEMRAMVKQSRENERRIANIKARVARRYDNINSPVPFVKQIAR